MKEARLQVLVVQVVCTKPIHKPKAAVRRTNKMHPGSTVGVAVDGSPVGKNAHQTVRRVRRIAALKVARQQLRQKEHPRMAGLIAAHLACLRYKLDCSCKLALELRRPPADCGWMAALIDAAYTRDGPIFSRRIACDIKRAARGSARHVQGSCWGRLSSGVRGRSEGDGPTVRCVAVVS